MPNGYHGPLEEWERMEAPLLEIDESLAKFAAANGINLDHNYHNWPRRDLVWVDQGIHRTISILLANQPETYHMGISAWQDKNSVRYTANEWLRKSVSWAEIKENLQALLDEAFRA